MARKSAWPAAQCPLLHACIDLYVEFLVHYGPVNVNMIYLTPNIDVDGYFELPCRRAHLNRQPGRDNLAVEIAPRADNAVFLERLEGVNDAHFHRREVFVHGPVRNQRVDVGPDALVDHVAGHRLTEHAVDTVRGQRRGNGEGDTHADPAHLL